MERRLAISASGRFVALRGSTAVEVIDIQGTAARRSFALGAAADFAIVGATLCIVDAGALTTETLEGAVRRGRCAVRGGRIRAFRGRRADAIVVAGDSGAELVGVGPSPAVVGPLPVEARPLIGRGVAVVRGDRLVLDGGELALRGALRDVVPLFGGRVLACLSCHGEGGVVQVMSPAGAIVHRLQVPAPRAHAFAIERGVLVVATADRELLQIDLRYGRVAGTASVAEVVDELAIDDDARSLVVAADTVTLARFDEVFRPPAIAVETVARDARAPQVPHETPVPAARAEVSPAPVAIPDLLPLALGARPAPVAIAAAGAPGAELFESPGAEPFESPGDHLAALLDLVAARAATAIAEAWHTGRLSADADGDHPFQREVAALAGLASGFAPGEVAAAAERLACRSEDVAGRVVATLAAGAALPFVELARELALSPIATQILAIVMAPRVRGEIARLYRVLANDPARPTCDASLVELLVGADDARVRDQVSAELAPAATLMRWQLVRSDARGLVVDDVVVDRLRGRTLDARLSPATVVRGADVAGDALAIDRAALRDLVLALADPAPARLVIRGRRGAGRHAAIAALAARVGRPIACIDAAQLPRQGAALADALHGELVRASLAGCVPVVSGLERIDAELDTAHLVRQVLDAHPGPVVVRTAPEASAPLAAGHADVTLPVLDETARAAFAATAFAAAGIAADADRLAARYRIGPGTIVRVAREAARRLPRDAGAPDRVVATAAAQHVATRMGSIAQRVTRLAAWDQIALPDDMLDSLRELIGRARHGRTVFEDWGYDARITTARGLTALFYGPPGTGKTLVAGLVARELGLDLYRVDLAKVMSKWVGETEKNLGEVFDAAEDGRLMLLFDEADSLFAKRTEVKSSNDRYANLEVNYLLQRLDAFEGVAILTTNLEGSIDPAFKRRLSMRLYFPFPDEDIRAQLWASHITPQIPTTGAFDFPALARRFPLSGGYIRNSAVRAAFLAAQEGTALSQAHLERAVLLEYRELGKLAQDGRLE